MENKELLEVLGRIAGALEEITEEQKAISEVADELRQCIGFVPPRYQGQQGYSILRIGGEVQTD